MKFTNSFTVHHWFTFFAALHGPISSSGIRATGELDHYRQFFHFTCFPTFNHFYIHFFMAGAIHSLQGHVCFSGEMTMTYLPV